MAFARVTQCAAIENESKPLWNVFPEPEPYTSARECHSRLYSIEMRPLGYHITKTAYGQWLPGDERGHWSAVSNKIYGQMTPHGLNEGNATVERFAKSRMREDAVLLTAEMQEIVWNTVEQCAERSTWSIETMTVEPTHMHLTITGHVENADSTCKWLAQQTTKAIHKATSHQRLVWAIGKWCEAIFDEAHWENIIAYINRHPNAKGRNHKAANGIRKPNAEASQIIPLQSIKPVSDATPSPPRANDIRGFVNQSFTIISGGQTGADRAALDFAIAHRIPHEGWAPRGRMAEDGPLDACYHLHETESPRYDVRTRLNIDQSDATVVFATSKQPTGGTGLTLDYARRVGKPVLLLDASADKPMIAHAAALRGFLQLHRVERLNVAGPRASQSPTIAKFVTQVLELTFAGTI